MAQIEPINAYLGPARTGLAIGATLYQLDGSTVYAAFSTTGWYEAPAGSGAWHHPGLSLPDAGGVVAVGISGTEYTRVAVGAARATASALTSVGSNVAAILADTGTDGVAIATATLNAIADAVLGRSVANVEDTASIYTIAGLILAQFESSAPGTTWTIKKTDGTTTFATRTLTEDISAKPVTGVS